MCSNASVCCTQNRKQSQQKLCSYLAAISPCNQSLSCIRINSWNRIKETDLTLARHLARLTAGSTILFSFEGGGGDSFEPHQTGLTTSSFLFSCVISTQLHLIRCLFSYTRRIANFNTHQKPGAMQNVGKFLLWRTGNGVSHIN